jgi:O-Antigen ligase
MSCLVFSTVLGDATNINFWSMESYRGPDRGFEVTLTDLLAFGLGLGLLLKSKGRVKWLTFNSIWLALVLAWATLCTFIAPLPLMASFTLFKLMKLAFMYWMAVNLLSRWVAPADFMNGVFAIGWLMTFLAVKQKYLDGYYRIPGPFDHSNTIPIFLMQILPLSLLWGLCNKKVGRFHAIAWLVCTLGMTFAIAATQSRAGLAVVGLSLLVCLLLANRRSPNLRVMLSSGLIAFLCLCGAAKAADTVMERFRSAPKASEEARHEFNHAAVLMAHDRWSGVGLNNFSYVLTKETRYNAHIVVMANEEQSGVAHHIYLLTAAETGWFGLGLSLIVLGRFWWLGLSRGLRGRGLHSILLFGLAVGFGAVHLLGFLEWALRISPVCYQLTLVSAFAVALKHRGVQ